MTRKGHSYLDLTALPEIGALLLAPRPAWLWSLDAGAVLWANAAGARFLAFPSIEALLDSGPDAAEAFPDITEIATGLGESAPQMLPIDFVRDGGSDQLWCLCSRFTLGDGTDALLIVATDEAASIDPLPVRAGRLVQSIAGDGVAAAIARRDGRIIAASAGFGALADAAGIVRTLADDLDAASLRLKKRKERFGSERRLAGAAAAKTPDGDVVLIVIGPAEERPKAADEPSEPRSTTAVASPASAEPPISVASIPPPDKPISAAKPVRTAPGGPRRFTFSLGPDLAFTAVSDELAVAVGSDNAAIVGRRWQDVATDFGLDDDRTIANALERRDTWSGVTVRWPAGDGETVAIDLTAIPSFRNGGAFEGFRGFGVIRAAKPAEPEPETTAAEPEQAKEPVPSNVVRLPSAERAEAQAAASLSGDEQDAFRRIADALRSLGKRPESLEPSTPPPDEAPLPEPPPPAEAPAPPRSVPLRVLDRVPIGLLVFREQSVLFANRALLDRLGYVDVAALAFAGGVDALFAGEHQAEPGANSRVALKSSDGSLISGEARLHVVPWDGGPATMLSVRDPVQDERPRRAADQDAALARIDELEAILDTATDGTLVLDAEGRILSLNRSAEALFGIEGTDYLGKPFTELLAEESHKPAADYLDGLARNGVASLLNDGREVIGRVPNGGLIPLFMTMGRLSEREKFCAVLRDITQWKNAEEELVTARRSAEIANKQKSDFLAKISHEIRTPLNAIIGFSDVMIEERFGPIGADRYREYLKDIRLSGTHLMSLINDLLDLSKIESGKLDLAFGEVAINQIVQECVALMQPEANRRRVIIRTSLADDVPRVVADERSLRQIALNLLSNAVKFNVPGGQVIVSTALDKGEVILRIRDTGIGMSEDEIEKAMKPFQQIATSGPARFEGTGLGLPLTKALVEANRAAFAIDSVPNQGTLVRISFPIERVLQR